MRKTSGLLIPSLCILFYLVSVNIPEAAAFSSTAGGSKASSKQSPSVENDDIAITIPEVVIDGEPIPRKLIITSLKFLWVQKRIFHQANDFNGFTSANIDKVVETLSVRTLLEREGRKTGVQINKEEFDTYFEEKIESMGGRKPLGNFFEPAGLTFQDYRLLARSAYAARLYAETLYSDIRIPRREMRQYYEENQENFGQLERRIVTFIRILFPEGPAPPEAVKELQEGVKNIKTPVEMSRFADSHSARYRTHTDIIKGVSLTPKRGSLVWPAASQLAEGKCGYYYVPERKEHYLVFVTKMHPGNIKPFDSVRDKIERRLIKQSRNRIFAEKVAALRERSSIEINYPVK